MNDLKLNYQLHKPEERVVEVERYLAALPNKPNSTQLEMLSDYILQAATKADKKSRKILTENRLITINKRETSYEGLVTKLENGEDGIYNMMSNEKNQFLTPKVSITAADIAEIPELEPVLEAIKILEKQLPLAQGKRKYYIKKHLIELHQQQYQIKNDFRKPMYAQHISKSPFHIPISETVTVTPDGVVSAAALISLLNPTHVSLLLCNYSELKQDNYDNFNDDMYYLMQDLDDLIDATLKDSHPLLYSLLIYKIDGLSNAEIKQKLLEEHGTTHSVEYISCLWRNKIPKLIADKANERYLEWYYMNVERGKWKKCSRCGQIKLANNRYFSKNNTSKDKLYSICKECRNAKNVLKKSGQS